MIGRNFCLLALKKGGELRGEGLKDLVAFFRRFSFLVHSSPPGKTISFSLLSVNTLYKNRDFSCLKLLFSGFDEPCLSALLYWVMRVGSANVIPEMMKKMN